MITSDYYVESRTVTEGEIREFEEALRELERELKSLLASEDPTKESITPDKAIGRLTRMEAIQAQSMSDEGRRRQEKRLVAIERALERIGKDAYGKCVRCGDPIAKGRLEIMPESAFCVKCAARR